ncbi:MAG TPA: transporter substrate-binding protein, partial [Chloroflexota bacterium]|nr:transporter substrate-binding protein [Chloroflexota bacterium]
MKPTLMSSGASLAWALAALSSLASALGGCDKGSSAATIAPTADKSGAGADKEVIVGQLHSATGTMAISETGSIQAERLAIDQINDSGGLLGKKIRIIQEDGASDWPTFAEKA